jgi:hypothetical protein
MWIALATQLHTSRSAVRDNSVVRQSAYTQIGYSNSYFGKVLSYYIELLLPYCLSTNTDTIVRGVSACNSSSSSSSSSTFFHSAAATR